MQATQFKCAKLSVFDGISIWCKAWSKIGDRLTTHKYFCFTQKFISHGRQILKQAAGGKMLLSHKYLLYLHVYKCNLSKQTINANISLTFMTHFRTISVMMVKNKIQTMMMLAVKAIGCHVFFVWWCWMRLWLARRSQMKPIDHCNGRKKDCDYKQQEHVFKAP